MKLKNIAAVAMAAAMSLAMLTACSGGGGSAPSTGWMRETIEIENEKGTISEANAETDYYATNGEWFYKKTSRKGEVVEELIDPNGRLYDVDTRSNPWTACYDGGMAAELVPTSKERTEGTEPYKEKPYRIIRDTLTYSHGKETRYNITTYYYDNTGLQYIKEEKVAERRKDMEGEEPIRSSTYVVKKVRMDKALDEEAQKKLDLKNYK